MIYEKALKKWMVDNPGETKADISQVQVVEGKKELIGKPEWSALPMDALVRVVRVFEKGELKYKGHRTWLPGIMFSKLFSAIVRHLFGWFYFGHNVDYESGEHPLCHVIANCLMLLTFIDNDRWDDRGGCNENTKKD